ncbi:hypothetical protein [Lutibacter sp.]|uniref:hypothetical protein n=1 Tax=Lutibacter sp. TaxID=1925666 RepID=UPI001A1887E4|nr:hypothetical protein [Lutibacter sp.]MBI9041830.1 hypothetical protein [Lutibacter sp.]
MKRLNIKIKIIAILFLSLTIKAQEKKDTINILFVGNSYTYFENMPHMVSLISDNSKTKLVTKKSVVGGAKLSEHWLGQKGLKTQELIKKGKFDIVVLQEHSMGSIKEADSLVKYSKLFCNLIKENGAKPYLYMTWAREKVPQYQEEINKVYSYVADENDAMIVPVGKTWELAMELRPNIKLFDDDGSHPNQLGAFLTACTFVGTILGNVPDNLGTFYSIKDAYGESIILLDQIDALDVIFLTKVVNEIIMKH